MEDEKLKELFGRFNPELSSDRQFMDRICRGIDSVEMIKRHTAELHRRSRKAVVVAALAGFIVGVLFMLALPYISSAVANLHALLPDSSILYTLTDNYLIAAWLLIGTTSVITALNTYDLTLHLLSTKSNKGQR